MGEAKGTNRPSGPVWRHRGRSTHPPPAALQKKPAEWTTCILFRALLRVQLWEPYRIPSRHSGFEKTGSERRLGQMRGG